jgi:endonuclease/exonuclease/phosphatase family metal-dependent hydrolase
MSNKRMMVLGVAAAAAALFGTAPALSGGHGQRDVTVMTRNLYFGASLDPVLLAPDFPGVVGAVTQVWMDVQATDFDARVVGLADEIEAAKPDLIGLQEAALWRIQTDGDLLEGGTVAATEVVYDFVEMLRTELRARGLRYKVAVSQDLLDVELPNAFGEDIRLTDRDVILVRRRKKGRGPIKILRRSRGEFDTVLELPVGGEGGPVIAIKRGWVAVDAKVKGKRFRFVNAHLEDVIAPPIQEAQANELIAGPLDWKRPVICVGDFNSDALGGGTASYDMLLDSGLVDSWSTPGGATWGHAADLRNPTPNLTERLDLVLHDGTFAVKSVDVIGEELEDMTESGLWPSDHAGVIATFSLKKR